MKESSFVFVACALVATCGFDESRLTKPGEAIVSHETKEAAQELHGRQLESMSSLHSTTADQAASAHLANTTTVDRLQSSNREE